MLIERLEDFFSRTEEARERDYFYVSEVAKCPRQIYYSVKGFPRPPLDGQSARRLAVGDDVHRRIVGALFSMGVAVAAEVPIPPNPLFHGRADVIVSLGGETFVVEIKSVHPYQFDQTTVKPKRDHYLQLQLYLHYLNIPRGIILMENKANQALREFVVERDVGAIQRVLSDFSELHRLIFQEGKLPPLPDKSEWEYDQCRYCPFVEFCVKDQTRAELLEEEIAETVPTLEPAEGPQAPPGTPAEGEVEGTDEGSSVRRARKTSTKRGPQGLSLFDL